ncbi:MAG: serine/threonine-protein phosphatase [Rhodanobacteraceae bacterium]|nr:MAG: serine/threonine-protein phosphatase [Rhodanobacteraceae bacterium]
MHAFGYGRPPNDATRPPWLSRDLQRPVIPAVIHRMIQGKARIRGTSNGAGRVGGKRARRATLIGDAAAFSKMGTRQANEDSYAFWWVGDAFFAAVADGLGGMGGGAHASSYVVGFMRTHATRPGIGAAELAEVVRESHRGLRAMQKRSVEDHSMATTLTVMRLHSDELVAAHCGDSRLYMIGRERVEQLTEDHSEAQRLFNEGRLSQVDLASYPRRHILESALGIPGEPVVQEIRRKVGAGDWLVLATDGAYGMLEPHDLADVARESRKPRQFSAACLGLIEVRGPQDNYTIVVARASGNRVLHALKRVFHRPKAAGNAPHCE